MLRFQSEEPELLLPFAFLAARFSFKLLLAAVLEPLPPPLSLLAMTAPSWASCPLTMTHEAVRGSGFETFAERTPPVGRCARGWGGRTLRP